MLDIVQVITLWYRCTHQSVDQMSRNAKSLIAGIAVKTSQRSLSRQNGFNLKPMFDDINFKISGDEDVVLSQELHQGQHCSSFCSELIEGGAIKRSLGVRGFRSSKG